MKENYDYITESPATKIQTNDKFISFVNPQTNDLTILELIEFGQDKIFKIGHYNLESYDIY